MIRRLVLILLTLLLLVAAGCMTALFIYRQPTPAEFEVASPIRPVALPCDAAAHDKVRTEWWYYTGFVEAGDGQEYGFELVFFKAFLPPQMQLPGGVPLNFISNPLYFAHFAVSDQAAKQHVFYSRSSFPRFWEAGAREDRFEVWNGSWRAWSDMQGAEDGLTCSGGEKHYLRAAAGPYALRLDLAASRPAVLHGLDSTGVLAMGQSGASSYYSFTDLEGLGTLTVDGKREIVRARAWMDHQWGSWAMHGGLAGWDWFGLRLDDGTRLMLFGFRDEQGGVQVESSGTWIAADGALTHLDAADFEVQALDYWTSTATGARYPVRWQVAVPGKSLDVTVTATFPEQEVATGLGPDYWEGTVAVAGTASGEGFVELTGY